MRKVLLIGAAGRTGRLAATEARRRGWSVRALVSDPARAKAAHLDGDEVIIGTLHDADKTAEAISGVQAVVFMASATGSGGLSHPSEVDFMGVEQLAQAASAAGVGHFVLLSSAGVTQPEHPHNSTFNSVLKWKAKGEQSLRASPTPHTIVRALGLRDRDGGRQGVRLVQGDRLAFGEDIARADVAGFLVDVLDSGPMGAAAPGVVDGFDRASILNATFEIYNDPRIAGGKWAASVPALVGDDKR